MDKIRDALINKSVDHLSSQESLLAIFPARTKGSTKLRQGAGMVLEHLDRTTVVPVAITSKSQQTSNMPKMHLSLGEPITTEVLFKC